MINASSPVVAFGELLLRLDTPAHQRFVQAADLHVSFTGGEANVAVALAQWGLPSRIVSRVPSHEIGEACLNHFQRYGVDVSHVVRGGERLGLFFVETGAPGRTPRVIYDRDHSAFRRLSAGEFDWDRILAGAGWLHVTGTAPAVSPSAREALGEVMAAARSRSIPISFDCSYRSALWSIDQAATVLPDIVAAADVFLGSESDARNFLDVQSTGHDSLRELRTRYDLRCVAFTSRRIKASGRHTYAAIAATEHELYESRSYDVHVVDRIGAGDAFSAGIIRGLMQNAPLAEATEFAAAAAALAHTVPGDFALVSVEEVDQLVRGDDAARGWR